MSTFTTFFSGHEEQVSQKPGAYVRIVEIDRRPHILAIDAQSDKINPESKDIKDFTKFNGWKKETLSSFAHISYGIMSVLVVLAICFVIEILFSLIIAAMPAGFVAIAIFLYFFVMILFIMNLTKKDGIAWINKLSAKLTSGWLKGFSYINNAVYNIFN